ncbi:MAG: alanine--glyoxylate aminotransferase family protein [Pseudomonadota bacterium]|nr:alanine--glyoxylate aminotransferase family protein [Pseudomonadota bacterium]
MERNLLDNIEEILLMGPGPSCVPPEVYRALARPTLGHLDAYFLTIMDELKILMRRIMNTENDLAVPVSGTGSAGMEACFVNLLEPGDRVLVLINGVFGARMREVASRLGAEVEVMDFPWGTPVIPSLVGEKLQDGDYRLLAVVHGETSTGVANPVAEIGALPRQDDCLYLVDAVTSLGGMEVKMDAWGIDALYSGTQKCLSCPPGLAPLSFSPRATARLNSRRGKVPNWYLDLSMIVDYWGKKRVYHHTAPVNMLYGLYQALEIIFAEGIEEVFARHRRCHALLVRGLEELGLRMVVDEPFRLPMLNTVYCPTGVDEAAVRRRLRTEHRIEIGGGLGPLAGKIWRIGLMGHGAVEENVGRFLSALRATL